MGSRKGILYIDPIGKKYSDPKIVNYLKKFTNKKIDYATLEEGPSNLEYKYYESLTIPGITERVKWAESNGYEGVIIGCFYDPGLYESREITSNISVAAPGESSMGIALNLGYKFSIIAGSEKYIPIISENIKKYGYYDKLASIKNVEISVNEFRENLKYTKELLISSSKEAVKKDMAEVLILGCTMQYGLFEEIQKQTKVPVLDPIIAALKYCEMLIEIRKSFGWGHSKRCLYKSPDSFSL